jgi:hypothetical protein
MTYGFVLLCEPGGKGHDALQVSWEDGNRFDLDSVTSKSCSDDPGIPPNPTGASFDTHTGIGTGRYNGAARATIEWEFSRAAEPGSRDTVRLRITVDGMVVLDVPRTGLEGGLHQVHNDSP